MPSRLPQSSKETFEVIKDIIRMGEVEMPSQFRGTGAPGDTLEFLCNIERNNHDSPDLNDWEVKFHGGVSLLTLLHKEPEPRGIMKQMVNTFGWESNGHISFRHTISGNSELGFTVINDTNKVIVRNNLHPEIEPFWSYNTILNAGGGKIRRLILVPGTVNKHRRTVTYTNAIAYWDLKLNELAQSFEDGIIKVDFDARTKLGRGTALRNHGTKFRIKAEALYNIYESNQVII